MLRMEIACFLILGFIAVIYFRGGRKKATRHKTFSALLIVMLVHLVFDGMTVYTVNHLDSVPPLLNEIIHRVFMGTMLLAVYLYYRHILFVIENETGKSFHRSRVADVYLAAAELGVALLPVSYTKTPYGNYSGGLYATVLYISVGVYILLCAGILFKHSKELNSRAKLTIYTALIIESGVAVVQAIFPTTLISGMGLTLMTLAFYLTLENPDILQSELTEQKLSMLYLKSQINPHFLYNTLDSIRIEAQLNNDTKAAELLMNLADFYRLSIKSDGQTVTLDDEMEMIYAYMELMCFRYPGLKVSYEIPPELGEIQVPNFIIQPLVENSLLHGLKNKGYNGELKISAKKSENGSSDVEILIADSGSGFTAETKRRVEEMLLNYKEQEQISRSVGVLNVQKRVKLLCGKEYGLWYTENETGGVTAHLLLNSAIRR